jgi:hypothetical protein
MFWRMRSGMGDAVFAPLYKVLLQRDRKAKDQAGKRMRAQPVQFHFLHALRSVDIAMDAKPGRHVRRLVFAADGEPATLDRLGDSALDDFGAWPESRSARFGTAVRKGTEYTRTLEAGVDFDAVIFAIGFDDFVAACEAGTEHFFERMPPEWGKMRRQTETVATQSAQVWLDQDLAQLGWRRGSGIITALGMPFSTWADMTHTLATEASWGALADARTRTRTARARSRASVACCPTRTCESTGSAFANTSARTWTSCCPTTPARCGRRCSRPKVACRRLRATATCRRTPRGPNAMRYRCRVRSTAACRRSNARWAT